MGDFKPSVEIYISDLSTFVFRRLFKQKMTYSSVGLITSPSSTFSGITKRSKRRNKYTLCYKMISTIQRKFNIAPEYINDLYEQFFISKGIFYLKVNFLDPAQLMLWITKHKSSQEWNVIQKDMKISPFLGEDNNLVSPPPSPQTQKTYQFISENFNQEQTTLKRCSSLEKIKISSLCNED